MGGIITRAFMRVLLSVVFIISGLIKLGDPERFYLDLQTFPWFHGLAGFLIMLVVPWWELLAALGILTKRLYRGSMLSI